MRRNAAGRRVESAASPEAKSYFDRAYENLNPGSQIESPTEAALRAGTAHVSLAEGIVVGAITAQQGLSASIYKLSELVEGVSSRSDRAIGTSAQMIADVQREMNSAIARYEQAVGTGTERLERWSRVQTWTGVVLAIFTAAQVFIAVLEYLQPS